jgi:anaerobic carbon-monoxide dehydrogenase iron sulfur subunit
MQNSQEVSSPGPRGRLFFDPLQCRTCRVCEVACSISHEGTARPAVARLHVALHEFQAPDLITGTVCAQCADSPCLTACPVGAMARDARTGAVVIDEALCTGCLRCRRACPWQVPARHPDRRKAIKCDLCSDRAQGPVCVEMCPLSGKALRYEPDYYLRERKDA